MGRGTGGERTEGPLGAANRGGRLAGGGAAVRPYLAALAGAHDTVPGRAGGPAPAHLSDIPTHRRRPGGPDDTSRPRRYRRDSAAGAPLGARTASGGRVDPPGVAA